MAEADSSPVRLSFDGSLSVRTIAPICATLCDAVAQHAAVELDCSAAESVDLAFVQLLLAARRTALATGKRFMLAGPAEGALRTALQLGGFLPPDGADPFWSGAA